MFLLKQPAEALVREFLDQQRGQELSYREAGASAGKTPAGYFLDHERTQLGAGKLAWQRACDAVLRWKMFEMPWVQLHWRDAPIETGSVVAISAGKLGLWSLNAAKIVYTVDETADVHRFGFAYGTLPDHIERGEERFLVEWNRRDDSVWYDLLAFSWPNHFVAQCGFPYVRRLQKRFRHDSLAAMRLAVE